MLDYDYEISHSMPNFVPIGTDIDVNQTNHTR